MFQCDFSVTNVSHVTRCCQCVTEEQETLRGLERPPRQRHLLPIYSTVIIIIIIVINLNIILFKQSPNTPNIIITHHQ